MTTPLPQTVQSQPMIKQKYCLPHVCDLSESIKRFCRYLNPHRTLRTILNKVNSNPPERKVKGVVYKVDCSCEDT